MKLQQLLGPWFEGELSIVDILHIENDSRKVMPGTLFFAYPGAVADGRKFIASAIANGAVAVVYEPVDLQENLDITVPAIPVHNLKDKLAAIAARFYANPSHNIQVIGVTGTNGKTTVAYQLASAYKTLGAKSAYIGTIGQGLVGELQTLINTTPDGLCLQGLLAKYQQQKVAKVCMEVSSHALCEGRVEQIEFVEAIYTNLSQEHLDYHKTMSQYAAAKAKLFENPSLKRAIINVDDEYAQIMLAACPKDCQVYTYGFTVSADFYVYAYECSLEGCKFKVKSKFGDSTLSCKGIGKFNIYNSLAIFISLTINGYPNSAAIKAISNLDAVSGRMEIISKKPYVFVDYSHTPDALENALAALVNLRSQTKSAGNIWVVFGCGGDRDPGKRAQMGAVASDFADHVIVTSDNPRTEDPKQIINDILKGIDKTKPYQEIINREEAIITALRYAKANDSILISGKGHEDYQIIGTEKIHFSDKNIVIKNSNLI